MMDPTRDPQLPAGHYETASGERQSEGDQPPRAGSRKGTSKADVRVVAKGGVAHFIGFGINRGVRLLFVALAVRLLGPAAFGLYRQVAQILQMTGNLGPVGFDSAVLRSVAHARATNDSAAVRGATRVALVGATLFSLAIALAIFGLADPIAGAFADDPGQQERMAFFLRLGAAFVPLWSIVQVLLLCTQGYKTNVPNVIVGNIIQPVSLVVVSVAALLLGFGIAGAIVGLVLSGVLSLLAAIWYYRRTLTPDERSTRRRVPIRPMIKFALPQAGVNLFRVGGFGIGIIVLGLLGSDRDVGLYAIAVSLQGLALIFPRALTSIWQPMVADLDRRGETARLESLYQTINRWVASSSFFVIAVLIFRPEPFVRVIGGQAAAEAAILTSILTAGTLFSVGTGPCATLIAMTGRPAMNLLNSVVGICIYVGLSWLFVPTFGAVGMAAIDALVTASLNLARVVEAKVLTGIQPFGRSFLKPVAATLAAAVVLYGSRFLPSESLPLEFAGIAVAGIVYVAVLLIAGADAEERFVYQRAKARFLDIVRRDRGREDESN